MHRLRDLDLEALTATCEEDGAVAVVLEGTRPRCRVARAANDAVKGYRRRGRTTPPVRSGPCDLCGRPTPLREMDHDHATGAFRGMLCRPCNVGLGCFQDNVHRMRAAIAYLETQNGPHPEG